MYLVKKKNEIDKITIDDATNLYNYFTINEIEGASVVVLTINGEHGSYKNRKSAKIYYITEGRLIMNIEGFQSVLYPNDSILVGSDTWYSMVGENCTTVVITTPAFRPEDEEHK